MKTCPSCGQQAPLNAAQCQTCRHLYRTQFVANQTQAQPQFPSPQPPARPKWWQWFIPGFGLAYQLEKMKFEADLLSSMNANGAISPRMRKDSERFHRAILIIVFILLAFLVIDTIVRTVQSNALIDAEMKRLRELNSSQPPYPPPPDLAQ
jgi:hypothetical protein